MEIESQIIDKAIDLEKTARSVEKEKAVAVDLEADSMYHYQEKVCLIQIATEKISVVIDPLAIKDLSPLKPFFPIRISKRFFTMRIMMSAVFTGISKLE